MLPISVFIITKDEEDRVPLAIKSVRDWVEEVIIVDSGSTDKTVEIAKELGAKVFFNEWKGYGPQKVFSEKLCKNKWLLNIDADEEISPELRDEIIKEFTGKGEVSGSDLNSATTSNKTPETLIPKYKAYSFIIKVVNRFSSKAGKFAPAHIQLRLYHSDYAGFKDSIVHDSVILKEGIKEKIYQFKNPVLHRTFRSYEHAIAKINRYSSMQAENMLVHGRRPSSLRIIIEPFISFLKGYFIKRHCFLGVDGFVEGIIYSFARTLRLAKARELWAKQDYKKGE